MRCISAYGEASGPGSMQVSDALSYLGMWWEDTQCMQLLLGRLKQEFFSEAGS